MKQLQKTYYKHPVYKKESTLDCEIKILSKLFLNQQEDVLETFEI